MTSDQTFNIFVSCPLGLQYILEQELQGYGLLQTKAVPAGVYGDASLEVCYRILLWSSIANRVLLNLSDDKVESVDDIYKLAHRIPWGMHFGAEHKIAISFSGSSDFVRNTTFGAMKIKDAIADYFRDMTGQRPSVDKHDPDIHISARLAKGRLSIALDLSGESLHKRGYRSDTGEAPLKENLAAAILKLAGWPENFGPEASLVDPMCGSGTFLIEGARLATRYAPGFDRLRWGFDAWAKHDGALWASLLDEARTIHEQAKSEFKGRFLGYDQDAKVIRKAWHNVSAAGLDKLIHVERRPLELFSLPEQYQKGLLATNPPYGERLGDKDGLKLLYANLGQVFARDLEGWKAAVFTGELELGHALGWRSHKQYKLFNGAIESSLLLIDLLPERRLKNAWVPTEQLLQHSVHWKISNAERAQMFRNRLSKNDKQLSKWARRSEITCYRIYDADIPEFAIAVDRYQDLNSQQTWLLVQEYAAPAKVDERMAIERLSEALAVLKDYNECDGELIVLKTRRVQKGSNQYEKQGRSKQQFMVEEQGARFEVNLHDYLDTGLFLDHRPVRRWVRSEAAGKTCLNLFCYTGAISVAAAAGAAKRVDSVDMSNTYLEWAKRNFDHNLLSREVHRFIQADCISWLEEQQHKLKYDLIVLDPPSFSNSKRMDDVLDIQRDHPTLIEQCMNMLNPDGVLVFSNNLRKFKLDPALSERYQVKDWKQASLDKDFERNAKIHHCWMIRAR